jgi:hypothetical protein
MFTWKTGTLSSTISPTNRLIGEVMTQLAQKLPDRRLFHLPSPNGADGTISFRSDNDANLCIAVALELISNQMSRFWWIRASSQISTRQKAFFAINPCDGDPAPVFACEIAVSNEMMPILYDPDLHRYFGPNTGTRYRLGAKIWKHRQGGKPNGVDRIGKAGYRSP